VTLSPLDRLLGLRPREANGSGAGGGSGEGASTLRGDDTDAPRPAVDRERAGELSYTIALFRRDALAVAGLIVIAIFVLTALAAPFVAPYPEQGRGKSDMSSRLLPPSRDHLCGTDRQGRDIFSRILFGARISLEAALIVTALAIAVGVPLGGIAGYFGGRVDEVIMRVTDLFLAFPALLLAIAIVATLGPGLKNAIIAIAVSWWPWYTRIVRGSAISLRERPFVQAARATGVSPFRIIFEHIVPNCLSPVIVQATIDIGSVILATAGLSFVGLGAQPPAPEWGLMVSEGRVYVLEQWWYATFPGLAIFLVVLAFNLVGDGARDALDPRLRR